ncbi:MAG: (Fe-S)-binding protein, partial [bacterium]|nr:(Fe-S)-binding protein [bacterium]
SLAGLRSLRGRPPSIVGKTRNAQGERRGVAAVLAGCVMDAWFGDVHTATVELLTAAGWEVVSPRGQTCCGALAAHDGWADDTRKMASTNMAAFRGVDLVVVNSAGCGAHMKEYDHWVDGGEELATRVVDVNEVVAEAIADGTLPRLSADGGTVAVQDPCHLRHVQRITEQPRAILAAAGLTVVEIDPEGRCCGAAGIYSVLEPEMSRRLGSSKADQVQATGAPLVASANPGCEIQLRTYLSELGHGVRVAHPVEIYWEALQRAERRAAVR